MVYKHTNMEETTKIQISKLQNTKKMGQFIEALGQQAATAGMGTILGMALGDWNDRRQRDQQRELQKIQIGGNKEMMDYSMMKQLEMWKATNYAQQVAEMRKAGLSPGLIYGMKGGGGVTTGSPGGSVQGGTAPSGGGEVLGGIEMGMQLQLLKAQKENIEADTANKRGDAANKPLVGENLQAGTENAKANTALTNVRTEMAKIEQEIQGRTKEDAITAIQHGALKIMDEARSALAQANVDEATYETEIQKIQAELAGIYIRNAKDTAATALTVEQTNKIGIELAQQWNKLGIDQQNANTHAGRLKLEQFIRNVTDRTKLAAETAKGLVQAILLKK